MMDPSDKVSDRALLVLDISFLFDPIIHILADHGLLCFLLSQGFESDEVNSSGSKRLDGVSSDENSIKKTCADCGTTKTPLWRGGPAGPKVISRPPLIIIAMIDQVHICGGLCFRLPEV